MINNKFFQKYFVQFWTPMFPLIILAIMAAVYFGLTTFLWAVTGEFTRWGAHILQFFGMDLSGYDYYNLTHIDKSPLERSDGYLVIGMFIGALVAALWANNFKIRMPQSKTRIIQAMIGGIIAGYGARLGSGCNLANVFTGIPYFSLHTWVFSFFMVIGIYLGCKFSTTNKYKTKIKLQKVTKQKDLSVIKNKHKQLFITGTIIFILTLIWAIYLVIKHGDLVKGVLPTMFSLSLLFGFGFGFIIERAQICFTSAFRDLFLLGRTVMVNALFISMIIGTIIVFAFTLQGIPIKEIWVGPNVVIGGLLFGFGIVFAGGCECGWMYRAAEGQVHYIIVGIGNIIGTILLALTWDYYADAYIKTWPKINLLKTTTNYGALLLTIASLILSLYLINVYKDNFFAKKYYSKKN